MDSAAWARYNSPCTSWISNAYKWGKSSSPQVEALSDIWGLSFEAFITEKEKVYSLSFSFSTTKLVLQVSCLVNLLLWGPWNPVFKISLLVLGIGWIPDHFYLVLHRLDLSMGTICSSMNMSTSGRPTRAAFITKSSSTNQGYTLISFDRFVCCFFLLLWSSD